MRALFFASAQRLKVLRDRLANAAHLDNANVPVSSLAPKSVALSDAVWTTARANNLNAPVSGIATQASANGVNGDLAAAETNIDANISSIKNSIGAIQTGVVPHVAQNEVSDSVAGLAKFYVDIPISAVTVNKSIVLLQGWGRSYAPRAPNATGVGEIEGELTSSTNLRVSVITSDFLSFSSLYGEWFVMEFN